MTVDCDVACSQGCLQEARNACLPGVELHSKQGHKAQAVENIMTSSQDQATL